MLYEMQPYSIFGSNHHRLHSDTQHQIRIEAFFGHKWLYTTLCQSPALYYVPKHVDSSRTHVQYIIFYSIAKQNLSNRVCCQSKLGALPVRRPCRRCELEATVKVGWGLLGWGEAGRGRGREGQRRSRIVAPLCLSWSCGR